MGSGGDEVECSSKAVVEVVERMAVVLDFSTGDTAAVRIPRRIRRRLLESSSKANGGPSSVEEIEAKLREANIRRQQFHEWLSNKARPKPRSPSWSSQEEDLGQRLEAKLVAAEQKRLSLLAKAQMRLAKLDELRQAAKNGVELRVEKEREELGTKVEIRVKQAEANRMRLLKAHMQRRAVAKERTATSLSQRIIREDKYKECVRSAIFEKRTAAEKKRMRLLEAEKRRVHAQVVQASKIAKNVYHQREIEQRRLKEQLEKRLQRAKRQRTEYLRQKWSPRSSARVNISEHGDLLSRKLARCWRRFVKSRNTTLTLAKAYGSLKITENSVKRMPFEELAFLIESAKPIETTKALLDRLETCFLVLLSSSTSNMKNIDHLLKRLGSPSRRGSTGRTTRNRGATRKASTRDSKGFVQKKLSRYPVRIFLCAYMILGHPCAVFSGQGEHEVSLRDSAIRFILEFERLIKVILDGYSIAYSSKKPSSNAAVTKNSVADLPENWTFRGQLAAFDTAWCSYLYHFVAWKVKDARSLEEDLVRAACQLELSMMQTCKISSEGQTSSLTHDMRAIQKQVVDDQKLLREKVLHLSGDAGVERMESALSDTRSRFFEAKESGTPLATPVAHILTPSTSGSWEQPLVHRSEERNGKPNPVSRSLFHVGASTLQDVVEKAESVDVHQSSAARLNPPTENELIVNEILHQSDGAFVHNVDAVDTDNQSGIQVKIKETMEKAFWDEVMDSMKEGETDYGRIISLVKEVRDELCELAPERWKQEIVNSIDHDILTQVVQSRTLDMVYFRRVLEYSLDMLQKLSASASENEMKEAHQKLLHDLTDTAQANNEHSLVLVVVKGLRFVLEEIQKLKKEVSKARIQLIEPIIKGSAGLEYLQKAFFDRYGAPPGAANSLSITLQWLSPLTSSTEEEWSEHIDFLSSVPSNNGLPTTTLRTGGSLSPAEKQRGLLLDRSGGDELPGCSGEKVDKLIRLGLLKLASAIEGWTTETVPETMKLNVLRLRSVQSQLQQIIVAATSVLVLRQILLSENSPASPLELQNALTNAISGLYELFNRAPDAGIEEIVEVMMTSSSSYLNLSSETKLQSRKEMLARMLTKSLQNGDAVFVKVSQSIYLATRGLLLAGTGGSGRKLADVALKRVGAAMLLDRVVKVAEVLLVMASVTTHVHGPWYHALHM